MTWYVEPTLKSIEGFASDSGACQKSDNILLDAPELMISQLDKRVSSWEKIMPRINYKQAWDIGIPQRYPHIDLHVTPFFESTNRVVYCPRNHTSFYKVVAHEYTHATGLTLNRPFYRVSAWLQDYAGEELIAELGARMLLTAMGFPELYLQESRAYLKAWAIKGSILDAVIPAMQATELLLKV